MRKVCFWACCNQAGDEVDDISQSYVDVKM